MTDPIRTPDDENTTPGFFHPPFKAGWHYQGATYGQRVEDGQVKPGHSDFSVDFNRRTPSGGWLQDLGDPVLAAAAGTVAQVVPSDGLVTLNHPGAFAGEYRTEYRHMQDIVVKVGDKVQRGDRIGSIGDVAGSGRSTSPHLHHRHWRRPAAGKPFQPIRMAFLGIPLAVSVANSSTRPPSWTPPTPVMVQGQPERATWQGAYQQAARRMTRAEKLLADCGTAKGALEGELKNERGAHALTRAERDGALARAANEQGRADAAVRDLETATRTITAQGARIEALERRVAELEALPPSDCVAAVDAERARVLDAVSDAMDELVAGLR
jgi:hypothetical protein